ncbi:MAG: magnesium transporter CorA family protein [Patescibacteria group bacterium]
MAIKELKHQNLTWINIDQVDEEAIFFLKKNYHFHQLDLEDLQNENHTPKIDNYKNYLFIILQFPHWQADTSTIIPYELDAFMGDGYLITIQHSKSKEMKNFFYRCLKKKSIKKDWMSGNSGYLFYRLLEALFKNSQPILNNIGRLLSQTEEEIFAGELDLKIVRRLGISRRNILHFRRIMEPQRYLAATLSHTRRSFLDESLSIYFDDITDYLNKLWAIIGTYKDTVEGLHVTVESLINQRTNKVISALTVISVSLLPLTLLSGIYGMNVINLPFAENPKWVLLMFLALFGIILFVIYLMNKKKWI